jgi:hypothetical protein
LFQPPVEKGLGDQGRWCIHLRYFGLKFTAIQLTKINVLASNSSRKKLEIIEPLVDAKGIFIFSHLN